MADKSTPHLPARVKTEGELLVRNKVTTPAQFEFALAESQKTGKRVIDILKEQGLLVGKDLLKYLSDLHNVPEIDVSAVEPTTEIIRLVPFELAERHQLIPLGKHGQTLMIAIADPGNLNAIEDLRFSTNLNIDIAVADAQAIQIARERLYRSIEQSDLGVEIDQELEELVDGAEASTEWSDEVDVKLLTQSTEDNSLMRLVNLILIDAIQRGVSDIHIEVFEKMLQVRYRIDGILHVMMKPPMKLRHAIVSRIKIMASLDISERRLPQDGRIHLKLPGGKTCDFRVSTVPFLYGEKVVLRLLDRATLKTDMTQLGFDEDELRKFKHAVHQPYGMVLVTGPTGSGKTTTLYSALTELNKTSDNISTAEDPVEFHLDGVNQLQVNDPIGLTFANVLRSFLRQDPDIIMVGEIRDFETAEIAIKAALTGHLVLSTLHTNDAPSTISRLANMGVEPFMIASSLNLIAAQRLVRRVCGECAKLVIIEKKPCMDAGLTEQEYHAGVFRKGDGCKVCGGTGYKGRIAIYELMPMSDTLRDALLQGSSPADLKRAAVTDGMQTLRRSALKKFALGQTTLEEVLRVTRAD
ncbi:type IV-A pilus assembly ATPase PilB [Candidatus Uhrbacteria bacterium RIFCSPHIGHO2_02_FULL_47_44]|uniref:Type IV-A pilus assembly ATPase PilB n=1 Tax=Candidatus Uhrbacteria bacterium RIFCSPLOWO2_02_FULL_48_18 TaxID=1802408 RepID=A0A1F7V9M0_9BACT|nr:MAG: type IV-A pilus assembly ATPase PilB [Candidatus Uhrbacteria bacterium RIFCSPHIGHO2_02_FULL_47_44]OGL76690.1 MAG: type IV-A pilus assembly ATPase PilB [Candidatus Uhrbacteria bacterium RIFCSPHIGHO2_12_FULL_47_12]OGL82587.1 MAG: type IV-A pilus assembly ATPase PilB [Candidatus Uhrbacteria bacterium RIFCSPLOWO2_01_FULL_47_17]OGL86798.1 MAG: type IV-A pilus assembly ATPase PilB [Candidatus Uhrbacteria bacterium RIFCSPLOWO2_02_FULL_48_18]OGL91766.1 MAG: type IV-A pilus assembly ATPase PilB 